ncbi:MAG: carboxypeptidase-like regulatory domain-containing protein [Bacteroidales bacterium]|nr:carboxypeptidase-like regulatory domain-containing protein [Bacteroidales bacterium]
MNLEVYILRSAIISALLIVFYHILLKNDTNYRANRYFFLTGLIAILIFPLAEIVYRVTIPYVPNVQPTETYIPMPVENAPVASKIIASPVKEISLMDFIYFGYLIGMLFFVIRLLWQLLYITKRYVQSEKIEWGGVKVCIHPQIKSPYVLGNRIFVGDRSYLNPAKEEILIHERIHLKQNHWVDMLLSELVIMVFWFNPLVWYYGRLMKQNLEFIADKGVLDSGVTIDAYLKSIICETMGAEAIVLANHFRDSRNKKRLKMMKKVKNSKWRPLKMLLLLPAIGLMLWAFSKPEYVMKVQQVKEQEQTRKKSYQDGSFVLRGIVGVWDADTAQVIDVKTGKYTEKIIASKTKSIGATVYNPRTNERVETDSTGKVSINVSIGDELSFLADGYVTQRITIKNKSTHPEKYHGFHINLKKVSDVKKAPTFIFKGFVKESVPTDTQEVLNIKTGLYERKLICGLGKPIRGAQVTNVRTGESIIVNDDGSFNIHVSIGDEVLFSKEGYISEHFQIKNPNADLFMELRKASSSKNVKKIHAIGKVLKTADTMEIMNKETGAIKQKIITEGLPGATVAVMSSSNGRMLGGAVTNKEGFFEIDANKDDELVISFVGYKTEKVKITNEQKIDITMKEQTLLIDPGKYRDMFKGKKLPTPAPLEEKKIKKDITPTPTPTNINNDEPVFFIVENAPKYIGGFEHFWRMLYSMTYSKSKEGYEGSVKVKFKVTEKGEVKEVEAITNATTKEAEAAIKIITELNQWNPGRQRGKAVSCWLAVDVEF